LFGETLMLIVLSASAVADVFSFLTSALFVVAMSLKFFTSFRLSAT
jgi:hypothetical protein